jgi:uncharacterized RDD family membrane protein YckC
MASWLVRRDGKTMGPVTVEFLRQKAAAGQLLPTDEIKQQGRTDWVLCGTVKGLFPRTTPPVASGAGVTPPLPPRVGQPPAGGTASEFAEAADDDDFCVSPSPVPAPPPTVGAEVARKEAYARFLPRLAAFLLDSLIVFYLPVFVLGILAGLTVPFLGVAAVGIGPIEIVGVIFQLVLPLLAAAYFVAFEGSNKQGTWGKQIVGLRVEGIRGEQISVGKALGRYVSKGLSHLTFGLVFFMPLFTKRRQAMHDLMAATVVVDDDVSRRSIA